MTTDVHLELLRSIKDEIMSVKQDLLTHVHTETAENHREGHEYLDMLMIREAKRSKLWDAIIEKTISSLLYSALVGIVIAIGSYFKDHYK